MKICFTTNASPWSKFHGGGQIFVHNIAQSLSALGHEIYVIYTGPKNNLVLKRNELNYKCYFAPYIGYPITGKFQQLNSITVFKKIKQILKSDKFDIINSLGSESLFIPKLCKKTNMKFVISIEHPNLKAIQPNYKIRNPLETSLNLLRSRELRIIKYVSRRAKLVFTPSIFTKMQANFLFRIPFSKIKVINHGIVDSFVKNNCVSNRKNGDGSIIFFGRLEPQKGVDLLIKAYAILAKSKIINSQNLIIIGNGPSEKEYHLLSKKMGLNDRVQFKGWRNQNYIKTIMSSASICVLPSRWESFGLAIAESLSLNIPVVTTLSGSIPEVVDFGKGAWIAKSNDVDSLTSVMRKALTEYNVSLEKARHGRLHVQKNYSWRLAAKSYEKFYRSLLNS